MSTISDEDLIEARKILGPVAKDWTDEQLKEELVKIEYLTETWLDEYEKSIFEGKTLTEIVSAINEYKIVKLAEND